MSVCVCGVFKVCVLTLRPCVCVFDCVCDLFSCVCLCLCVCVVYSGSGREGDNNIDNAVQL